MRLKISKCIRLDFPPGYTVLSTSSCVVLFEGSFLAVVYTSASTFMVVKNASALKYFVELLKLAQKKETYSVQFS
jgi:hypothetical protein